MKTARVFISVVGTEDDKKDTLQGFAAASGFFRSRLSRQLDIKQMPELIFEIDDSIADGERVLGLIVKVEAESSQGRD